MPVAVPVVVMSVTIPVIMPVTVPIVVVTTLIVSPMVFTPSAGLQYPAVRTLAPFRVRIYITRTWLLPMSFSPHMPTVAPIPETGNPHVTISWRWNPFISWGWRRSPDGDVNADLRHGLR
jgi:hypothetical protein